MIAKQRLLVTVSFSFSIRYIIRTGLLEKIRQYATPVLVFTWNEIEIIQELKEKKYEVYVLHSEAPGSMYANSRRKVDIWFKYQKMLRKYGRNQRLYLSQFESRKGLLKRSVIHAYNLMKLMFPGYRARLFQEEKKLMLQDSSYPFLEKFVKQLNVQAVFTVTPFHRQEDTLLRVCRELGLKMMASILSFDNITKRGWIPVKYDTYLVWNAYNKKELTEIYPNIQDSSIHVVGAPQFDFYFKPEYLLEKNEWLKLYGLEKITNRKIILYSGGPQALFPNEPLFVSDICSEVANGSIAGNPLILFRCHPMDEIERWQKVLQNFENVLFDHSWTGEEKKQNSNITVFDIKKLCSTLAYTDVHVSLCSTMAVDGSAYFKPQIGPAYESNSHKSNLLKGMYFQKHFLPVVNQKGLRLAESKNELASLINNALQKPEDFTNNSVKVLQEIITFTDGMATERVAMEIEKFLR